MPNNKHRYPGYGIKHLIFFKYKYVFLNTLVDTNISKVLLQFLEGIQKKKKSNFPPLFSIINITQ